MNGNGNTRRGSRDISQLTAREKKLLTSAEEKRNDTSSWPSTDEVWRTAPSDILSLKQNINFECSSYIPINFSEAWSFFHTCDMTQFNGQVDRNNPPTGVLRKKLLGLVGQPVINPMLLPQQDLIFSIASCPMNNDCSVHRRILQSIYVFMTKKPTCPRYGNHWEEVGFQGQDPASDLRGVGMFGALQMLYLSCSQETKETLAPDIYELSRHPIHQFPLAVLSLNVTRMTIDAFRDGLLNRFCNKKMDAISVVNEFYMAILYRIYKKWKDKGMTIHDSCFLLKAVEKWCRANPQRTFGKMHEYLAQTGNGVRVRSIGKLKERKRLERNGERNQQSLSWLDLTKPSLEVFI